MSFNNIGELGRQDPTQSSREFSPRPGERIMLSLIQRKKKKSCQGVAAENEPDEIKIFTGTLKHSPNMMRDMTSEKYIPAYSPTRVGGDWYNLFSEPSIFRHAHVNVTGGYIGNENYTNLRGLLNEYS